MKKKVLLIFLALLAVAAVWMIASGFVVNPSVYITDDFEVSEGGGVKPHYLKFYSAWGGLNSSLGAKDTYVLHLDPGDTEIYVYHGDNGYDLALKKDAVSGKWHR